MGNTIPDREDSIQIEKSLGKCHFYLLFELEIFYIDQVALLVTYLVEFHWNRFSQAGHIRQVPIKAIKFQCMRITPFPLSPLRSTSHVCIIYHPPCCFGGALRFFLVGAEDWKLSNSSHVSCVKQKYTQPIQHSDPKVVCSVRPWWRYTSAVPTRVWLILQKIK